MKKDYLFYGAFGIGVIALLAVLATYNFRSQDSTKDTGVDLNASNQEIMKQADEVDVMGADVTAEDAKQQEKDTAKQEQGKQKTTTQEDVDSMKAGQRASTTESSRMAAATEQSTEPKTDHKEQTEAQTETTATGKGYNGSQTLTWPVSGDVILPYSMDTTVYFQTLEQYKCNPGMLIAAEKGDQVEAVYAGTVKETGESKEFGQYLILELGNQYEVFYGQLQDIHVKKGDAVSAGDKLASVANPSSYYEKEGCHLYLAITKDGKPVNPVSLMTD